MIFFNSSTLGQFNIGQFNISGFKATIKSIAGRKALTGLARRIKAHKEMSRLHNLDDRMLKDIGIVRSDLDWAMAEAGRMDPLAALQNRRCESEHAEHLATAKAYCAAVNK
ncbi:MAG: DUF1127 domain-containing protein [bacterium]|nr:DUF1127 domain-containing protein [bacterium]